MTKAGKVKAHVDVQNYAKYNHQPGNSGPKGAFDSSVRHAIDATTHTGVLIGSSCCIAKLASARTCRIQHIRPVDVVSLCLRSIFQADRQALSS